MTIDIVKNRSIERAAVGRPALGHLLLSFAEALLLSLWLGAMVFFNFAVPQSAFAVLPSREMVGLVVTSTITKVELLGLMTGPLILFVQFLSWRSKRGHAGKIVATLLIVVMTACAGVSRIWITPRMAWIRSAMGGFIDSFDSSDPLRSEFNRLHDYSVALMSAAMFAGVAVLFLAVRSWLRR